MSARATIAPGPSTFMRDDTMMPPAMPASSGVATPLPWMLDQYLA